MEVKQTKSFNTIAERIIYGLNFIYSEFVPIKSKRADEKSQRKVHKLMEQMIDKLYVEPDVLNLAVNTDEAYEWYALNNSNIELDKVYKSITKGLYSFYKFLYITFLYGEIKENFLLIDNKILSKNKAIYKSFYKSFLNEFGIDIERRKGETRFNTDNDILWGLKLLAEKTPVKINNWTPYALLNFVCCSFTGDYSFLLTRVDNVVGLNGLLLEIEDKYIENGYKKSLSFSFGPSVFEYSIKYQNKVGGFVVGYKPRKYWQFYFGSMNSIGVKAMLEDFENLENVVQKYLITVCTICNSCLRCTKGSRNKILAVKIKRDGKEYNLCNDNYARHNWETINHDLALQLFKYHNAQEIYGSNWKKE